MKKQMLKPNPNKIKMTKSRLIFQFAASVLLTLFAVSCLYPFVNAIALSLNEGYDSLKGGIYLWPRKFTLENFKIVFRENSLLKALAVSVFRTALGTALHLIVTVGCAYSLSKRDLPGHKVIAVFFLIPTLFGGGIVPFYIILNQLHLTNTIWVYIFPCLFSFFNIVILRTYFENLPAGLLEAAEIDGCGEFRKLIQIVVPLSLPVIATITLYSAVGHWNDWFAGSFYITDQNLRPLQTVLVDFLKGNATSNVISNIGASVGTLTETKSTFTSESMNMAVLVITTLPILVTYPFLQKYFIKGVLIGSVKE